MTRNALINQFVEIVSGWEGIIAEPHRFGGTEFKFGKVEIGHIHHGNGMVDIPFTVKIRATLVAEGLADYHHLLRESGWITFFIRDDATFEQALWLMRLSYLQKTSRRKGIDVSELEKMQLSAALHEAAFPQMN